MPLRTLRIGRLSIYLFMASVVSIATLVTMGALGLRSMRRLGELTQQALTGQIAFSQDAAAFEMLLNQKGSSSEYLLTGDRARLAELDQSGRAFTSWLQTARASQQSAAAGEVLLRLEREYEAYHQRRQEFVALADAGRRKEALDLAIANRAAMERLLLLCQEFGRIERQEAELGLAGSRRALVLQTAVLLGVGLLGTLASLAVGFFISQRVGRPIYELQLQVESAVQRTRLQVPQGKAGLEALGEHVGALLRKLEETDAAILDQRRRLIQSEKLSAIGELAAKLAHEILNPLAGMKAAVQLLLRGKGDDPQGVRGTAAALDREIRRIEQLVRRLVDYARPLQARTEVCQVPRLLDDALEAAASELRQRGVRVVRSEEGDLPPLEIDRLLVTQALCNLLVNAAQATAEAGPGATELPAIELSVARVVHLQRECVRLRVADHGPGVAAEARERIFHPFFTTRPAGHGLGLAVSQNIALEHGGQILYHDRAEVDGPGQGAVFDLIIPLLR